MKAYKPDERSGGRGSGGPAAPGGIPPAVRERIAQSFTRGEDVVYVGLGVLLASGAVVLLGAGSPTFGPHLFAGNLPGPIIDLLDRVLLVVMIVELLYTVQVSFREHTFVPEPFLIVGLIAATRRILVVTAEFAHRAQRGTTSFSTPCWSSGCSRSWCWCSSWRSCCCGSAPPSRPPTGLKGPFRGRATLGALARLSSARRRVAVPIALGRLHGRGDPGWTECATGHGHDLGGGRR